MKRIFTLLTIVGFLLAFTWQAKALTYTVTVPDGTQACFIAGDMNGWSLSLDSRMTPVDGTTNQFTIDYPDANVTDGYHYYCGPDWAYAEVKADGTAFADGENRTWTDADVVEGWAKDFVLDERTVTINVLVPSAVYEVYLVGNFNNWSSDFNNSPYKMDFVSEDADGKVFSVDVTWIDVINMQFKFVAGPDWTYQQTEDNYTYGSTDNVINIDEKNFKAIFDPTKAGDITIKATVPDGTDKVWIQGSFIGWSWDDPDALEMTKQDDGTYTFTVPNVQAFSYKLYNWPDWAHCEYAEGDPSSDVPDRTATFDPDNTDGIYPISVFGWRQDAPTAIPQISADKFIVFSTTGQIAVEGAFSQVDIFNVTGQAIQSVKTSGAFTSKTLSAGVYIVRVDGVSQKVIVK